MTEETSTAGRGAPPGRFLRLAALASLLGSGWLALTKGVALRALLWDAAAFGFFPRVLGLGWNEWVTSAAVDRWISHAEKMIGVAFVLLATLLFWWSRGGPRRAFGQAPATPSQPSPRGRATQNKRSLFLIPFLLFPLLRTFLFWKEHFWQAGALLELGVQTLAPLLFIMHQWRKPAEERLWRAVSTVLAVTFIGHGLYAIGLHPVPAHFVFMTQSGLGFGEDAARQLLFTVGVLDFLAAGLLLLPLRKAWLAALAWVIPWAILTTLARLWSYGGFVGVDTLLSQWLPEVVVRLPHVFLPVALLCRLGWDEG